MEFKDYYVVLGVDPTVDDKAIKTAFRKQALALNLLDDIEKLKTENEQLEKN